ncbi:MAG: hypothetical protein K2X47_13135 [Bdellovibrionales bacterium]|nr:hypothetical protein [Bdellovibrionales bacterium]
MVQGIGFLLLCFSLLSGAYGESLPIAPRRQDSVDQVSKVIFSSPSGIDPKEGNDPEPPKTQAAPLKTADVAKIDEKVPKLKQTSAHGKKNSPKITFAKKATSARKPAASGKGLPKKKSKR